MDEQQIHQHRLHERELEFQHRMMELELAGSGIKPVGITPQAPAHGASQFVELMQQVDVDRVCAIANEVQQQGYAIVNEEFEAGFSSIAAPIFDRTGRVAATISIAGPTFRIGAEQLATWQAPLTHTTQIISTELGYWGNAQQT